MMNNMKTKKLKVLTIVGTRPEIIRLSRTIAKLDEHCEHVIAHTGQNYDYELNEIFFNDLQIRKPDYFLNAFGSAAETIGRVIIASDELLLQLKPDAVLILGDTNSCLCAIAAKRRKIPIFHMEAGNRCFDMRVPEEINRRIIDHTADVNLTYSTIARNYLLREGLLPELVIKTGSPLMEVLNYYKPKIELSDIIRRLGYEAHKYFVISLHREENVDPENNFLQLVNIINAIADKYNLPIIVSTHPRTRKRIDSIGVKFNPLVNLSKPLGFCDYIKLQTNAKAVLSDSGTITEESSILNFPALSLRETNERPEGFEEGAVMLTGCNLERILQGLEILETQSSGKLRTLNIVEDYNVSNVSEKIVRIIHSYTDYVNRVIWKKYQGI
jgi:UDP-N-acetylglucosamine 2-epimerase